MVRDDVDAHPAQQAVVERRGPALEHRIAATRRPHAVDDVEAFAEAADHGLDHGNVVLQIRIDRNQRIAGRRAKPRQQRTLMSLVARQLDAAAQALGGGREILDDRPRGVVRAVIDEVDAARRLDRTRIAQTLDQQAQSPRRLGQDRFFVEAGHHDVDERRECRAGVHGVSSAGPALKTMNWLPRNNSTV